MRKNRIRTEEEREEDRKGFTAFFAKADRINIPEIIADNIEVQEEQLKPQNHDEPEKNQ